MKAVLDTSPIISLSIINKLPILESLFSSIYIPKAVWKELSDNKAILPFSGIKSFFNSRKIKEISKNNNLTPFVDCGESEAIILAKEINADYLIIDDKRARSIAEEIGLECIGTLGLLYRAKEKSLITELKPLFTQLIANGRYYSKEILNFLLSKDNEELIK